MDMSLVAAIMMAKAGAVQQQVSNSVLKSNLDAEKSAVMTLLGTGEQNASSLANVAAGIGSNLDMTA
jgi:hypothetical protein